MKGTNRQSFNLAKGRAWCSDPDGRSAETSRALPQRSSRDLILSAIQSKPDLQCHLPVPNLVILQVAPHLDDFKPIHIAYCFARSTDRVVHCVLDSGWRGTDYFDLFVDVVAHE